MISQGVGKGGLVSVDFKNNEFVFEVKKGKKIVSFSRSDSRQALLEKAE
jgi:hypothetical protein